MTTRCRAAVERPDGPANLGGGGADVNGILPMIKYYLRVQREHPPTRKYNSLQKAAYTTIPLAALGATLTGVAIYWPVQFQWVTAIFSNYDTARVWHFIFMAVLVLFFGGHLFMVIISGWTNFLSMITGWKKVKTNDS